MINERKREFKRKLTAGFEQLRRHDYFARECFCCCQSCGCATVPDRYADRYVFYHEQDAEHLDDVLAFTSVGAVTLRKFAKCLRVSAVQSSMTATPQSVFGSVIDRIEASTALHVAEP